MNSTSSIIDYENSYFLNFVVEKKYRWMRHAFIIFAIVAIHFLPNSSPPETNEAKATWIFVTKLISIVILLIFFYVNHNILIPKLLIRSKFLAYLLSILAICSFVFLLMLLLEHIDHPFIDKGDERPLNWEDYIILLFLMIIFVAAVSSLKLFKIWIMNVIRFKEYENNTLTIQLEQLKSQINPHFLFNTLNNINFLITENPKMASIVLLKLSDILRNQLYLSKGNTVELADEIMVLRNILFMEEIRRDDFLVDIQVQETIESLQVPHFLFMPFIENVVKHGAHQVMNDGYHVIIAFNVVQDKLIFTCINPIKKKANNNDIGGLGLTNVRKRLAILYPGKHELVIDDSHGVFKVVLSIPIEK